VKNQVSIDRGEALAENTQPATMQTPQAPDAKHIDELFSVKRE
jgi:hypothetical protein